MPAYQAHPTAIIDPGAVIGDDTRIWHFAHICSGAKIGAHCSFGQNTMVADSVTIGQNVKVQNNVAIYSGTHVEDDVFLGPSCVLTNVTNPRAQVVRRSLYEKTWIRRGATIGANATIVCGITLGRYAFIAAGAVVTADVPDYGLILGVPGRLQGHMSRHGHRLHFDATGHATCPESGLTYYQDSAHLVRCLDLDEDDPLQAKHSIGKISYDTLKARSKP
jgi:UDP-2-acetamido-3-amino-2,3-dideoxy-glucuronate N-acetyltransferase